MAIKKLTLDYLSNDWSVNYAHQVWFQVVGEPVFAPMWVVKDTPVSGYDVQKGLTLSDTVGNILIKIQEQIDALLPNMITVVRDGNKIVFSAGSDTVDAEACALYLDSYIDSDVLWTGLVACAINGEYLQAEVTTEIVVPVTSPSDNPVGVTPVNGLSSNGYKINNDIWIDIPNVETGVTQRVEIVLKNLNNQRTSTVFTLYPTLTSSARLNLSPLIKSLFDKPAQSTDYTTLVPFVINTNWADYEITVRRYFTPPASSVVQFDTATLTRTFIRSGERVNKINLTATPSTILRPTVKLPIWSGYPTSEYFLKSDYRIEKRNDLSTLTQKDYRSVLGCDGNYIKFLNQNGSYSNWYFEGRKQSQGNSNLGYSNDRGVVQDFGNEMDLDNSLYSKVPLEYLPIIDDLFISPEIYLYTGANTWERITSDNNKLEKNHFKRVYEVNFKFKRVLNFNPSVIW